MSERPEDRPDGQRAGGGADGRRGRGAGRDGRRGGKRGDGGGRSDGRRSGAGRGSAGRRGGTGRGGDGSRAGGAVPERRGGDKAGKAGDRGARAGAGGAARGRAPAKGAPAKGRSGGGGRGGSETAEAELPVDPDVTGRELDEDVRAEFGTLSKSVADEVARHLVMAARLVDEDPEQAYRHALAARRRAGRVGVVREAAGVAAYLAGRYAEALGELRAARRITGSAEYLPMMADCERGLGRPRRALDLAADPAGAGLPVAGRIELLIVAAGARRDLGDFASAVVSLQVPELRMDTSEPWLARLRYAYADALEAAGRDREARRWFLRAMEVDLDEETDAADRVGALDDVSPPAE